MRKNYVLPILCISPPVSASVTHFETTETETKVRNVYGEPATGQALHQVSIFNSHKNLKHGFIFSVSQGKI